jgi:hypothetical protein
MRPTRFETLLNNLPEEYASKGKEAKVPQHMSASKEAKETIRSGNNIQISELYTGGKRQIKA